jgi:hypothetical protein
LGCPGNTKIKCGNENAGLTLRKPASAVKSLTSRNALYHGNMQKICKWIKHKKYPTSGKMAIRTKQVSYIFCISFL